MNTDKTTVYDRLKAVIIEQLGVYPKDVAPDCQFNLKDDSDLVMAIEEEFGVEITAEAAENVVTVADAYVLVKRLLYAKYKNRQPSPITKVTVRVSGRENILHIPTAELLETDGDLPPYLSSRRVVAHPSVQALLSSSYQVIIADPYGDGEIVVSTDKVAA